MDLCDPSFTNIISVCMVLLWSATVRIIIGDHSKKRVHVTMSTTPNFHSRNYILNLDYNSDFLSDKSDLHNILRTYITSYSPSSQEHLFPGRHLTSHRVRLLSSSLCHLRHLSFSIFSAVKNFFLLLATLCFLLSNFTSIFPSLVPVVGTSFFYGERGGTFIYLTGRKCYGSFELLARKGTSSLTSIVPLTVTMSLAAS